MQKTILFNMLNSDTSIDIIQDYLEDEVRSKDDLLYFRNLILVWGERYNIDFKLYNINEKWLVIILLLNKFPEKFNLSNDTILYNKINEFIKYLNNNEYPETFNKMLITLKIVYDDWKKNDWNINMQVLIELYLQYELLINNFNINDDKMKELWILFRDELFSIIKKICPTRYEYNINKYRDHFNKSNNHDNMNKLKKIIENYVKNEYWINMKNEYNLAIDNDRNEIMDEIIYGFNNLLKELYGLLNINYSLITIGNYDENCIIWNIIEYIKKYDCPAMDHVYDKIYIRWISNEYKDFIDIVKFLYQRLEIIISVLNKKDVNVL